MKYLEKVARNVLIFKLFPKWGNGCESQLQRVLERLQPDYVVDERPKASYRVAPQGWLQHECWAICDAHYIRPKGRKIKINNALELARWCRVHNERVLFVVRSYSELLHELRNI